MRELADVSETMKQPSIMCGDFNCSPGTAPYQLMETNQLSEEHVTALKKVVLDNTRVNTKRKCSLYLNNMVHNLTFNTVKFINIKMILKYLE